MCKYIVCICTCGTINVHNVIVWRPKAGVRNLSPSLLVIFWGKASFKPRLASSGWNFRQVATLTWQLHGSGDLLVQPQPLSHRCSSACLSLYSLTNVLPGYCILLFISGFFPSVLPNRHTFYCTSGWMLTECWKRGETFVFRCQK